MELDQNKITSEYKYIRDLISSWMGQGEISWEDLQRWMAHPSNLDKFLQTHGLENNRKNKKIINDICQDMWIKESVWNDDELFENLKILADHYQVSLSHIETLNPNTRQFKLTILENVEEVFFLTLSDIQEFEDKIWDHFLEELSKKTIVPDLNPETSSIDIINIPEGDDIDTLPFLDLIKLSELKKFIYKKLEKNRKNIINWVLFFDKNTKNVKFYPPIQIEYGLIWKKM